MPRRNATLEKTVVAKANEFERTGLFWETGGWKEKNSRRQSNAKVRARSWRAFSVGIAK